MSDDFREEDAPAQEGRTFVVTGANSGIGLEVSRMLAAKGAHVVMACRSRERGEAALEHLQARVPDASAEVMDLDLADLDSVRAFADAIGGRDGPLHGLLNNAGVMAIPRRTTAQGFEMQLGVNHLGHFALTGRLMPRLAAAEAARIVSVSSGAHQMGRIHFEDLMLERSYGRWKAYAQSKLANLLFTRELTRRLPSRYPAVRALACHPGYAATELQGRSGNRLEDALLKGFANRFLAQDAAMGALATLRAATDPELPAGVYVGPRGLGGARGYPKICQPSSAARDDGAAERLWSASVELTGVDYGL